MPPRETSETECNAFVSCWYLRCFAVSTRRWIRAMNDEFMVLTGRTQPQTPLGIGYWQKCANECLGVEEPTKCFWSTDLLLVGWWMMDDTFSELQTDQIRVYWQVKSNYAEEMTSEWIGIWLFWNSFLSYFYLVLHSTRPSFTFLASRLGW